MSDERLTEEQMDDCERVLTDAARQHMSAALSLVGDAIRQLRADRDRLAAQVARLREAAIDRWSSGRPSGCKLCGSRNELQHCEGCPILTDPDPIVARYEAAMRLAKLMDQVGTAALRYDRADVQAALTTFRATLTNEEK